MLVRVVAKNFVAGFVVENNVCVLAAPILRRLMLGRSVKQIRTILAVRGWTAHEIRTEEGETL